MEEPLLKDEEILLELKNVWVNYYILKYVPWTDVTITNMRIVIETPELFLTNSDFFHTWIDEKAYSRSDTGTLLQSFRLGEGIILGPYIELHPDSWLTQRTVTVYTVRASEIAKIINERLFGEFQEE